MFLILHGDNTVLSRQSLIDVIQGLQDQKFDLVRLNGKKIHLIDLIEACETTGLFGGKRAVIIEQLHSQPGKKFLADVVTYLAALKNSDLSLILWESKPLSATQLKKLPKFQNQLFRTSSVTFKFLDSLLPGRQKAYLPLFLQAIDKDTPEFVLAMLTRQIRLLLESPSPQFKIQPWQIGKLKSQARAFGEAKLISLHDRLYDLDWRLKTGQTVGTLTSELAFILSNL